MSKPHAQKGSGPERSAPNRKRDAAPLWGRSRASPVKPNTTNLGSQSRPVTRGAGLSASDPGPKPTRIDAKRAAADRVLPARALRERRARFDAAQPCSRRAVGDRPQAGRGRREPEPSSGQAQRRPGPAGAPTKPTKPWAGAHRGATDTKGKHETANRLGRLSAILA